MPTFISILALAVSATCTEPLPGPPVGRTSLVDATATFARQLDIYLLERRSSDGTLFSPPVAAMFRQRINVALSGLYVEHWLSDKTDQDDGDVVDPPDVHANERFPEGVTHGFPTRLLWCLPPLPAPLEYRIVGRQLVVLDLDLNVVVDVLPHAFGAPLQTQAALSLIRSANRLDSTAFDYMPFDQEVLR